MENSSSVEILKTIAKKENWETEVIEKQHHYRVGNNERYVVIKNLRVKDSQFISAQTINFDKYRIYSGIFFPIVGFDKYNLLMQNRTALDKINFRKNRRRFKIGNSSFDSKIMVNTNNDIETHKFLSGPQTQMEILKFMKRDCGLHIGINEINPGFNDELKGKSYLSLFITMEWMLGKEMIDEAFNLGKILYEKLNKK